VILRAWRGFAALENATAYQAHLLDSVRPKLERLAGYLGLYLVRRTVADEMEYQVLTLWESMDAIRAFAGDHPERAVVEPQAVAVLRRFDAEVRHYEVLAAVGNPAILTYPRT